MLKGKWIKPQDYISKDNLFYAADRALANVEKILYVNFKNHAAKLWDLLNYLVFIWKASGQNHTFIIQ